jgi:hypothetical protein
MTWLDTWEAATAAPCARNRSVSPSGDPTAIAFAVQIACAVEEFGKGPLCPVAGARCPQCNGFDESERFGDSLTENDQSSRTEQSTCPPTQAKPRPVAEDATR